VGNFEVNVGGLELV